MMLVSPHTSYPLPSPRHEPTWQQLKLTDQSRQQKDSTKEAAGLTSSFHTNQLKGQLSAQQQWREEYGSHCQTHQIAQDQKQVHAIRLTVGIHSDITNTLMKSTSPPRWQLSRYSKKISLLLACITHNTHTNLTKQLMWSSPPT